MTTITLATLVVRLKSDTTQYKKGVDESKKKTQGFTKHLKTALPAAAAAGAALAAQALKQFADESLKEFQQFENGMKEVFTLMPDLTSEAMASMEDDMLAFSAQAGRVTDETVPALYQAISAGVPQENVFDFLQVASDAARGGVTDLETAVDGITSVVNAYGEEMISAGEASDVMFTAVKLGKTTFEQLSGSLFNVIPTAASLGVKFEDVAASLAALTAQGTPTSVATTQLRQAFVEASKSGTNLDSALKRLVGGSFADLIASGMTSQEIFMELRNSMPEQEFRDLFGSVEAANAVLGITSETAQTIITDFGTLEDTFGATAEAASTMAESMETLEARSQAATEALKIQSGEALEPLKRDWLELKIASAEYLTQDLETRDTITQTQLALMEMGMTTGQAAKAVGTLGEGTVLWRDSMTDAETIARRTAIAVELLEEGFEGSAKELGNAAIATDDYRQATMSMTSVEAQAAMQIENSTAALGAEEAALAELAIQQQVAEQQRDRLIDRYASATAAQNDERDAIQEAGDSQERINQILAERAEAEAEAEAAILAAAEAERARNEALGGYFDTALTATEQTASFERQLYDAAVASNAGAAELAVLAAATGEFTEAEIESAFQAALMQEQIKMLAEEVAEGNMTADEAVDALARMKGQMESTAQESAEMIGTLSGTSAELDGVSSSAESAANSLTAIPTDIDVSVKISTHGSIPSLGSGPDAHKPGNEQKFAMGGFTGFGNPNALAGVVHQEEFVFSAPAVRALGLPFLERLHSDAKGGFGDLNQTIHVDARGNNNANDIARTLQDSQIRTMRRLGIGS